jgi:hypothetical protein
MKMSAFANPFLFTQVNYDSGALTQLGSVVHGFAEAGDYGGLVLMGDQTVGTFTLQVNENTTAQQTNIDLAAVGGEKTQTGCCNAPSPVYSVHPSGYAVFHVSSGAGGYSVTLTKAGKPHAFDSRLLQAGDIFSAVMLRPGTYKARTHDAAASLNISVSYPAGDRKIAYKPSAPARVVYAGGRFTPSEVTLKPAQGLVFEMKQEARVRIDLVKPDDGPAASKIA